jgi:hypothetical protein
MQDNACPHSSNGVRIIRKYSITAASHPAGFGNCSYPEENLDIEVFCYACAEKFTLELKRSETWNSPIPNYVKLAIHTVMEGLIQRREMPLGWIAQVSSTLQNN